ncbi:hypothetical protein [Microtetraspora niveoalba]|uniref:hypothetical protein n=1 Tax=Microtetraspora niveoalba TaxID=46175 RepID=UPI000AB93BE8|nr:hypothetical protein [Microtetraspora niveoalba]
MPGERRPPLIGVAYEEALAAQAAADGHTTEGFMTEGFMTEGFTADGRTVNGSRTMWFAADDVSGVYGTRSNGAGGTAGGGSTVNGSGGAGEYGSGAGTYGTGAGGAGGYGAGTRGPGVPRAGTSGGRGGPVIVTPFDPLRLCVYATVALLGWLLGPLAVLGFAGVGFAGYVRARRAGLVRSKCLLRDTRLVLAYLGLVVVAAIAALVLKIFT